MPRAKRICPKAGCPFPTDGRYCTKHNAEYEKQRGSREARGYGAEHRKARARLNLEVQAGITTCARCQQPIKPGEPWALDHDDNDRGKYLGPSHSYCNNSAGGKNAHKN